MDGIFRWNSDRASEAITSQPETQVAPMTYSGPLEHHTNMLWQELCGRPLFPDFKPLVSSVYKPNVDYGRTEDGQRPVTKAHLSNPVS
ncbi:hypothetical protein DPMN_085874 [Dreissena polymorpha]|uniref:Uncharacterized protein n=1 Tax=Dreissena polymorpha TaxID=45954 RepID=A0A9D3YGV3_DREPO|nr:hypothetical protein DPMN_085874 [Dreissena polymorpha]